MSDLVTELQALVTSAQAALDAANAQVTDPAWQAVQDALTANGWEQTPVPEVETPAEDATDVPNEV
jgi:hypothetical protein